MTIDDPGKVEIDDSRHSREDVEERYEAILWICMIC